MKPMMTALQLPDEVWEYILNKLSEADAVRVGATCRSLRTVLQCCSRWLVMCEEYGIEARDARQAYGQLVSGVLVAARKWAAFESTVVHSVTEHTSYVMGIQAEGDTLITGGGINDNRVLKWRWARNGLPDSRTQILRHDAAVLQVRFLGNVGASVGYDNYVRIFDVSRGEECGNFQFSESELKYLERVAVTPSTVFVSGDDLHFAALRLAWDGPQCTLERLSLPPFPVNLSKGASVQMCYDPVSQQVFGGRTNPGRTKQAGAVYGIDVATLGPSPLLPEGVMEFKGDVAIECHAGMLLVSTRDTLNVFDLRGDLSQPAVVVPEFTTGLGRPSAAALHMPSRRCTVALDGCLFAFDLRRPRKLGMIDMGSVVNDLTMDGGRLAAGLDSHHIGVMLFSGAQ